VLELAHALASEPLDPARAGPPMAPVGAYHQDPLAQELIFARFLMFMPAAEGGARATLTPTAVAWCEARGVPRGAEGWPDPTDEQLEAARSAVGQAGWSQALCGYVVPWLNSAEPPKLTSLETVIAPPPAHAVRDPAPEPARDSFSQSILDVTAEARALKRLDAAAAEAELLIAKGKTRKLDAKEADQVLELLATARKAAAPFLGDPAQ
jgi:hypothetical protein